MAVSHKPPGSRLPKLPAIRPAVNFAAKEHHCPWPMPNYAFNYSSPATRTEIRICFSRVAHGNRTQPNVAKREEINCTYANRIRWGRIVNVNVTIEIRSLVSEAPKHFKLVMALRRAAFSDNTSLIATFLPRQHMRGRSWES